MFKTRFEIFTSALTALRRRLSTDHFTNRSMRGFVMKKKSRIEMAREIISRVKREMDRPRLTESVRNGESGLTAQAVKGPAARSVRA
jgi:hypothetical protein